MTDAVRGHGGKKEGDMTDEPDNPLMTIMEERLRAAAQENEMLQRIKLITNEYPRAVQLAAFLHVLDDVAAAGELIATIDVGNDDPYFVVESVHMAATMENTAIIWLAPEKRWRGDGSTKFKPLSPGVHAKRKRHPWDLPAPDGQSE